MTFFFAIGEIDSFAFGLALDPTIEPYFKVK